MGLFSSKKKHHVATVIQRVAEDEHLPNTAITALIRAIIGERESAIPEHLIDGYLESIAVKADRMYRWAEKNYPYGLPTSRIARNTEGRDIVKAVIEGEIGRPITIDYFELAPINSVHVGWKTLVESYGYDDETNELTVISGWNGYPVYLKDMVAVFTRETFEEAETGSLEQWGKPATAGYTPQRPAYNVGRFARPSYYIVDDSATQDLIEVTYTYTEERTEYDETGTPTIVKEVHENTLSIPLIGFDEEAEYFQVRYHYDVVLPPPGGSGPVTTERKYGYWLYKNGSGGYPEIDNIHQIDYAGLGSYFPFAHFRIDRQNMADEHQQETEAYKATTKLVGFLGMDFQEVADAIHENPDIGDVRQASLVMAIPALPESEIECRYLYDWFNAIFLSGAPADNPTSLKELVTGTTTRAGQAISIKDQELEMTLSFSGISRRRRAGRLDDGRTYQALTSTDTRVERYRQRQAFSEDVYLAERSIVSNHYIYRKQVSSTFYDEIRVYDPKLRYHIYRKYGHNAAFGSDELLIPLDSAITHLYSLPDREQLYARSLHFVFNSHVVEKVRWYQRGWFKALMVVVSIVIMVWTGYNIYAGYVAGAMTAGAAAMAVLTKIVIAVALSYGFKLLVREIGGEAALVIAAIAMAVGIYKGGFSLKGSPWAEDLLKIANGLIDATTAVNQELIEDLIDEYGAFKSMVDDAMEELDAARNLLDNQGLLDPFEYLGLQPFWIAGESPQDYFNRTVHSGNIGVVSLDAIHNFVDDALRLPTLEDALQEFVYPA